MKFKLDEDGNFLTLIDSSKIEYDQLVYSFTKKVMNWGAIRKNNGKPKTFEISFIDRFDRIPVGLWNEIKKLTDKYSYNLTIEGSNRLYDSSFNESHFENWALEYFKDSPKNLRYYQIEGVAKAIKYRKCVEEISTSGGKTLMAFLLFRYLQDIGAIKKMLYVVPSIDLVTQTEEKFYELEDEMNRKPEWKSSSIFGGKKKEDIDKIDIVFGTWQSLIKYDAEFFKSFDIVFADECLHPDTLITMHDFSKKKIKDIKIGEKVWTFNETLQIFEIKEIEFVYKNLSKNQQMFELELENDNFIRLTGNHKVLLKSNIYKRVDELNENDEIVDFLL